MSLLRPAVAEVVGRRVLELTALMYVGAGGWPSLTLPALKRQNENR
ncbi:MAG: hypothetical protein ACO1RA_01060 [Planctomycetaceae bacterium]